MKATIEIVQCRASDVEGGDTVRLPGDSEWHLVIEAAQNELNYYKGAEDAEAVMDAVDDWMVVLVMNKISNRLQIDSEHYNKPWVVVDPATRKPYDNSGPDSYLAVLFTDTPVEVQVRHEITSD